MSRSSRPQPPSLSPKESNTYDDVSIDQSNDVFKVKTAEGSDETPSTSLTGRKRKTQVTSTSPTNRKEKQYTPYDQSAKTRNLSVTTQDEQTHEKCVCMLSVSDGGVDIVSVSLSELVEFDSSARPIKPVTSLLSLSITNATIALKISKSPSNVSISKLVSS